MLKIEPGVRESIGSNIRLDIGIKMQNESPPDQSIYLRKVVW